MTCSPPPRALAAWIAARKVQRPCRVEAQVAPAPGCCAASSVVLTLNTARLLFTRMGVAANRFEVTPVAATEYDPVGAVGCTAGVVLKLPLGSAVTETVARPAPPAVTFTGSPGTYPEPLTTSVRSSPTRALICGWKRWIVTNV